MIVGIFAFIAGIYMRQNSLDSNLYTKQEVLDRKS